MTFTKTLPVFDPRSIPVIGVDTHLSDVPAQALTHVVFRKAGTPRDSNPRHMAD